MYGAGGNTVGHWSTGLIVIVRPAPTGQLASTGTWAQDESSVKYVREHQEGPRGPGVSKRLC